MITDDDLAFSEGKEDELLVHQSLTWRTRPAPEEAW
jgi:hypothetical protein